MGIADARLLTGTVMHQRLIPKKHVFQYGIYYLAIPLSQLKAMSLAYNRFAPLSFFDKDHGPCDGSSLAVWARDILTQNAIEADGEITLVCMPRVFNYVFNPVSFWLCQDKAGQVRAILCEVHNTFGERHTYLCTHQNHDAIGPDHVLTADKIFHVSPFLEREGQYQFRFDIHDDVFNVQILFFNGNGDKQLVTALNGKLQTLTKSSLRQVFWRYPLITVKAIVMIHWHALKLVLKGISYIPRPQQKSEKTSKTRKSIHDIVN